MLELRGEGLSFDDVLIEPVYSDVFSRSQPLDAVLVGDLTVGLPIISANMSTVTELEMANTMAGLGGVGIIHRFLSPEEHVAQLAAVKGPRVLAIGVDVRDSEERLRLASDVGLDAVLIDVAHGHHQRVIDRIRAIKDLYPGLPIIAGNVASYQGTMDLLMAGADTVKVGVGPGSVCTTRRVTGCGTPQLTAIMEAGRARKDFVMRARPEQNPRIIADGGIRTSGDIVKAFAAGADTVMIGGLFAGTDEAPGEVIEIDGIPSKRYFGMASDAAMSLINKKDRTAEGVAVHVPYKGSIVPIVQDLVGGIRSGLSYCGCASLAEIHEKTLVMRRISSQGYQESLPHAEIHRGVLSSKSREIAPVR